MRIVNSYARRSTYDLAPECMTSALHITIDPAVGVGDHNDPAVRFWGFEATTTCSLGKMGSFNLAITISSLGHGEYAIPAYMWPSLHVVEAIIWLTEWPFCSIVLNTHEGWPLWRASIIAHRQPSPQNIAGRSVIVFGSTQHRARTRRRSQVGRVRSIQRVQRLQRVQRGSKASRGSTVQRPSKVGEDFWHRENPEVRRGVAK